VNTINRIILVVLLLALMVMLTLALILPHVVLTGIGEALVQWGEASAEMSPQWLRWVGSVFIAFVADALLAFLIYLEVRRSRKQYIRVQQVTGGMATVSTESIVQQLQQNLETVADVVKVAPKITAKRDKVQAIIDVEVRAGANVPGMATALISAVQRVLTEGLGLQVYNQPEVRIKVLPGPLPTLEPIIPPPAPMPTTPPPIPPAVPEDEDTLPETEEPSTWDGPPLLKMDKEPPA